MNSLLVLSVSIAITNGLATYRDGPGIGNLFDLVGVTPGPEPESTTLGLWQEPNQENQDQPEIAYLPFKGYQVEADKLEKSRLPNQNPSNDQTRFHGVRNSIMNHILTDFLNKKKRDGVNKEGFPIHYPLEDWDRTGNVVQAKPERGLDEIQRLLNRALQSLDPEDAEAVADKIELVKNSMVEKYGPYPQIASPDKPSNIFGTFNHPIQGTWESQVSITDFHIKAENLTLYLCAMMQWDETNHRYKCPEPWILVGGHEAFALHYPMAVSNPKLARAPKPAHRPTLAGLGDLSSLEYPDLDQGFIQTPSPERTPSLMSSASSTILASGAVTVTQTLGPTPVIPDRQAKPKAVHFQPHSQIESLPNSSTSSVSSLDKGFLISDVSSSQPPLIPSRALKAKVLIAQSDPRRTMQDVLDAERDLVEDSIQIEKKSLALEKDWELLRLRREREHDDVMRSELLKKEEALLEQLEKVHLESDEREQENRELREQLKDMKDQMDRQVQKSQAFDREMDEQRQRQEIRAREREQTEIKRELEKKRQERRAAEERHIHQEKEELERRAREAAAKRKEVERELEAKRLLQQQQQQQQQRRQQELQKQKQQEQLQSPQRSMPKSDTYKMPLKDDSESSFGSLNRSHSSPNIAQLLADEEEEGRSFDFPRPKIDRLAKPEMSSSFGGARNFQPVWKSNQEKGLTGLKNLGNTCYMNSVLQCMSNFPILAQFFMESNFQKQINKKSRTRGEFAVEFSELLRQLWSGQCKSISPKDLKRTFGKHVESFQGTKQQDAHEFLTKLVESLHDDLNEIQVNMKLPEIDYDQMGEISGARKAWELAKKIDKSFIHELFYGQMKSSLKCLSCGFESPKYETFFQLSLNLPLDSSKCTVRDCLERYLEPESVEWACPKCKRSGMNHKKLDIIKFPLILIIHLSRFFHDEYGFSGKKQNRVEFEINGFSVGQYARACGGKENRYMDYQLQGVCNHFGTLEGGHYTAYCFSQAYNSWFKYDDHEVTPMSVSNVKSPAAYMLFYAANI